MLTMYLLKCFLEFTLCWEKKYNVSGRVTLNSNVCCVTKCKKKNYAYKVLVVTFLNVLSIAISRDRCIFCSLLFCKRDEIHKAVK